MKEHVIQEITNYVVSEAIGVFDALTLLSGIATGRSDVPQDLVDLYAGLSADEKSTLLIKVRTQMPELAAIGGAARD